METAREGDYFPLITFIIRIIWKGTAELDTTKDGHDYIASQIATALSGIPGGLRGDVSGDGFIDSDDAYLILMYDAELIEDEQILLNGDVSGDGFVDSDDAYLILMFDAELIDKFPVG